MKGKEMEEEIICNRWKDLDGRNKEKKGKSVQKEETAGVNGRVSKDQSLETCCEVHSRRIAAKEITIRDCEPAASYKS